MEILTGLYNDVLSLNALKAWKKSIITVIHKSGAPDQPKNYRPITVIPILYKLFAMLLFRRLTPHLDREQCADQAGFRAGYRTDDHILTTTLLMQKAEEHQITLWIAACDYQKAFDSNRTCALVEGFGRTISPTGIHWSTQSAVHRPAWPCT